MRNNNSSLTESQFLVNTARDIEGSPTSITFLKQTFFSIATTSITKNKFFVIIQPSLNSFLAQNDKIKAAMDLFKINSRQAKKLGQIISKMKYSPISFDDGDLFPAHEKPYIIENFFFFMTAIDHKTSRRQKKKFKAEINGKLYCGSDLLYFLARKIQAKNPKFFTAENLKNITGKKIASLFSIKPNVEIKDPDLRAMLLRDASSKLLLYYKGDIGNLFKKAKGYLRRDDGMGILQQLKIFKAYEDPLEKKSLLFVKILRREGLLKIQDKENLAVPVDNVLMTIALRSGIVKTANNSIRKKLVSGAKLKEAAVLLLRKAVREAFAIVSCFSCLEPDILDDLLWAYGREFIKKKPSKDKIEDIINSDKIILNNNIKNKNALKEFLLLINGLGKTMPSENRLYKEPNCPGTWYF